MQPQSKLHFDILNGFSRSFSLINWLQNTYNDDDKISVVRVAESTLLNNESIIAHYLSNKDYFVLQADAEELPPSEGGNTEAQVTVKFLDGDTGEFVSAANSRNRVAKVDGTDDLSLGSFLARPTTIDTATWTTADLVGQLQIIRPWQLFMNNTAIKKKLDNYAFLRGKLHIKLVINATPFQFGALRVCYLPLEGTITSKIRGNAASGLVPLSQVPGFYIWPAHNKGGELELPFLYHKNWLDITSNSDVTNFGALRYEVFAPLDTALSGAPTGITLRTLAWMTDVELMGSTAKLALQGDDDEYGNGAISAPATAVANVASYLTKIPIIGPFARATQIGASAISKVASIFGFTNAPNIENVSPFYLMSAPQLATAEISVPYQKLALDPKTELSIDPTPFGVEGIDQLSLSYLKKHESYFGTATWTMAQAAGTSIMAIRVTPDLKLQNAILNSLSATVGYRVESTPLCYIANLFENWRGTLRFRFKVVCTQYHKGRLKFQYDPVSDISASEADTNVVYTHILDLGDTDEITIDVPYHQALAWLRVDSISSSDNITTSSISTRSGIDNGQLNIRVYNTLESPVSASTVRILCYVSGGDDLEFANPVGRIDSTGNGKLPSFFALQGDDGDTITFGTSVTPSADRYGLNFGESILSLRKLLHRSSVVDTVPMPTGVVSSYNIYRKGYCRMPYSPGFCGGGFTTSALNVVAAVGSSPYAFNTMHPLPWVTGMFVGYRGSVNYAVTVNSPKITPDDIRFIRSTDSGAVTSINRVIQLQTSTLGSASLSAKCASFDVINNSRNGIGGYALTSSSSNPTCLFSFPDFNNYNFSLVIPGNYIEGGSIDNTDQQAVLASILSANATIVDEIGYSTITTSAGAGADFTCIFFLCCPTTDWLVGDPTPDRKSVV